MQCSTVMRTQNSRRCHRNHSGSISKHIFYNTKQAHHAVYSSLATLHRSLGNMAACANTARQCYTHVSVSPSSHSGSQLSNLYQLLTLLHLAACNESALRLHTCIGEGTLGLQRENIQCRMQVLVQAIGQLALMRSAGAGPGFPNP